MDLTQMKEVIRRHMAGHAEFVTRVAVAERYYRNENDILFGKPRQQEDEDTPNPMRSADNRISRNFHGLLVNQKAAYTFTAPPVFDLGGEAANTRLADLLGDEFPKVCKDLCVDAANAGVAWLHYWQGEDGVEYGVVNPKEIIPIWSRSIKPRLIAALRVYRDIDDNGDAWEVYEYWTDADCFAFRRGINDDVERGLIPYLVFNEFFDMGLSDAANQYHHGLGEVPFVPFFNNNTRTDDLKNVKGLIDTYDKVYSGFSNDLEDIQEVIFVLTNYGGEDLNDFLSNIKKYKTVNMDNVNGEDKSGLTTLTIDIPVEAREKLLEITRKAIFEQGQGVDPRPENFGGNASGVALKYLYSLLEQKAGLLETEFRLGFGTFVKALCRLSGLECQRVLQTWTRTAIANDLETAQICQAGQGIISNETIVKNHPFVDSPADELKKLAEEQEAEQERMDIYDGGGDKPPGGGEEDV